MLLQVFIICSNFLFTCFTTKSYVKKQYQNNGKNYKCFHENSWIVENAI